MTSNRLRWSNLALAFVLVLSLVSSAAPVLAQDGNQEGGKLFLPLIGSGNDLTQPELENELGPQAATAPSIRLQSATFVPGELGAAAAGGVSGYAANGHAYYIVQFQGPVLQEWKDEVNALGGEFLGYIPDFAFKARMNPAQAAKIAELESVTWLGPYLPQYKLSPELKRDGTNLFRVRVERGADAGLATAAIMQTGAEILKRSESILLVAADSNQLDEIARVLDVAWVENFMFAEKHNEFGAGEILGANTANANGYDGSTQIVAVADTGLGDGTAAGAHPDIPASRITAINNWTTGNARLCYNVIGDEAIDVDSGHGTHTSVSVLGDGGPGGEGKGTAPAAHLVFQAVEEYLDTYARCANSPDGYYLIGLPDDLGDLYLEAYNQGARIHSNSWGSNAAGDYTIDSANTDDFIWNNPLMAITFSAGNEGTDANANGVVDNDSIGSPATAKNVITVGASENERTDNYPCDTTGLGYTSHDAYQASQTCGSMSHNQSLFLGDYGTRWPADFPANPIAADVTAGNQEQMAAFSSRGPTDDGRIKPDVVAPGTWVLSGYSSPYQEGYGDPTNPQNGLYQWDGWGMPFSDSYKYMGGTSMSNPIVAGAAAVVRDFYQKTDSHDASAALVKATLINSAVDLADENNDGAYNDFPIPNVHEGWGRVNLADATDGSHVYEDNTAGVGTNGSATYQYNVAAGSPFKVTLVWSDYPSTETAVQNLVNDLDLVVTAPGGATYMGNVFSGGWSQTGGSADNVNNVENVYVQSAAAGTWTVVVSSANVPFGPQPFALVVDGSFAGTGPVDNPPSVTLTSPADGATVLGSVTVAANAIDDNNVTQVEFFVDGTSIGVDTSSPYTATWDTALPEAEGAHTVTATATDTNNQTGSDTINVTVDNINDPPSQATTIHVGDLDGSTTSARGGKWNATVTITIHKADESVAPGATVNGTWSGGANGGDYCLTNDSGQCSITKNNINKNSSSATFTVDSVTRASSTYVAGDNHNEWAEANDDGSDGTSITLTKP